LIFRIEEEFGMLSQMREGKFIRTVLWIVVVSFVISMVFVWGADYQGIGCGTTAPQGERWVGMVADTGLSLRDFDRRYRQGIDQMSRGRQPGQVISEDEKIRLLDQVFDGMVNETLFRLEVERLGLEPIDQEIYNVLRFNPPEMLKQQFLDGEGNFDQETYNMALSNPNIDWRPFENLVRTSLPGLRLQQLLQSSIHVGEGEIRQEFERRFAKANVRFAGKNWRDVELADADPEESVLEQWFQKHLDDYQDGERYTIQAAKLSRDPSQDDEDFVLSRMDFIRSEILERGRDFAEMAQEYSQDMSNAENGGDLGWFGRGRMVDEFTDATFAMSEGEVSQPVRTQFGYHLIKLEEHRIDGPDEEVKARHILLKVEPSPTTRDSLMALADSLYTMGDETGSLATATTHFEIELLAPAPFTERESIEGIGFGSAIKARIATMNEGETTRLLRARDADYIVQLTKKQEGGTAEFASVQSRVLNDWKTEQKKAMARTVAEKFLQDIKAGQSWDDATSSAGITIQEPELFAFRDYVPGVGSESAFQSVTFMLNAGDTSGVIETEQGYFVLEVIEKIESPKDQYPTEHDAIRDNLFNAAQGSYFMSWLENIKERFQVEDYREQFYQ
jgi:peptidyl-prolyl cis-trans isomerase D